MHAMLPIFVIVSRASVFVVYAVLMLSLFFSVPFIPVPLLGLLVPISHVICVHCISPVMHVFHKFVPGTTFSLPLKRFMCSVHKYISRALYCVAKISYAHK